jgi:hypothetical protein
MGARGLNVLSNKYCRQVILATSTAIYALASRVQNIDSATNAINQAFIGRPLV